MILLSAGPAAGDVSVVHGVELRAEQHEVVLALERDWAMLAGETS
jgi:hypothetical protein